MTFYLGIHQPAWIGRTTAPLFLSHVRLRERKTLRRAAGPWALDSGGFSEIAAHGRWTIGAAEYLDHVARYVEQIGMPDFIAPQDWMCEFEMLAKTGLTVEAHQDLTVANYLELRELAPHLPIMPVLQGWTINSYYRCVEKYAAAGVDLAALPRVGVGSVCRRQSRILPSIMFDELHRAGIRMHGFGVKIDGLDMYGDALASADSMAWSYAARSRKVRCAEGKTDCRNCLHYALDWRAGVLKRFPAGLTFDDFLDAA